MMAKEHQSVPSLNKIRKLVIMITQMCSLFASQRLVQLRLCRRCFVMDTRFYWGAATAAYQSEGSITVDGKGVSIWDTFTSQPPHIFANQTGKVADDAYHKIKEDVAHIKKLGLNAYRFSIAWSRIYPLGYGEINMAGIDHYNTLIDELKRANIEPFVTLYHWDLPQGLEDKYGGWLSPEIETDFANFANTSFHYFGDRVKKWVTINEPWTIAYMGYGTGTHAPGRCSNRQICAAGNSSTESYIVGHNLLNAHAAAAELYRTYYQTTQQGEIGIVLNLDWGQPLRRRFEDLCAAVRHNEFQLGWFADPIFFGRYPDRMLDVIGRHRNGGRLPEFTTAQRDRLIGSVDFLGLNHYSTRYYIARDPKDASNSETALTGGDIGTGWAYDQRTISTKFDYHGQLIGPQGESEWLNTVPWGFYDVLLYVHSRYTIAYRAYRDYQQQELPEEDTINSSADDSGEDNDNDNNDIGAPDGSTDGDVEGHHPENSADNAAATEGDLDTQKRRTSQTTTRSSGPGSTAEAVDRAVSSSRRLRSGDCEVMCNCDPPSQYAPKLDATSATATITTTQQAAPSLSTPQLSAMSSSQQTGSQSSHSSQGATEGPASSTYTTSSHSEDHRQLQEDTVAGSSGQGRQLQQTVTTANANTGSASAKKKVNVLGIPIYVTENGCDAPGESDMPLEDALHDAFRVDYLSRYLAQLERAILAGVDIRGYFVWSLLDNFEWADGYAKRFGIIYVDYSDPNRTRYLKDSAHWYAKYIHSAQTATQWPVARPNMDSSPPVEGGYFEGSHELYGGVISSGRIDTAVSLMGSGLYSGAAVLLMLLLITCMMRVGRK